MLENLKHLLHRHPKPQPSEADKILMENVSARLAIFGLSQPAGTILRSIPGAVIKYEMIAGTVVPRVYRPATDRLVGHFDSSGHIVYDGS